MCTVSMIMDHYQDKWTRPPIQPMFWPQTSTEPGGAPLPPDGFHVPAPPQISKEEVEEFRQLLERARKYDKERGEPDCELEEKRQELLKLAGELGVDISFL